MRPNIANSAENFNRPWVSNATERAAHHYVPIINGRKLPIATLTRRLLALGLEIVGHLLGAIRPVTACAPIIDKPDARAKSGEALVGSEGRALTAEDRTQSDRARKAEAFKRSPMTAAPHRARQTMIESEVGAPEAYSVLAPHEAERAVWACSSSLE